MGDAMSDWEHYMRSQEDAAFGQFLVDAISDLYGCEATPEKIDRAVYKNTDCGAWCKFDEEGILVGTIVEGSEAEFSRRVDLSGLDMDEPSEELLIERFRDAIAACEAFAEDVLLGEYEPLDNG